MKMYTMFYMVTPTHSLTRTHADTHMLFRHLPVTEVLTTRASLVVNYKQNHRHSCNARMRIIILQPCNILETGLEGFA